jgi:hypothetical protein
VLQAYKTLEQHWRRAASPRNGALRDSGAKEGGKHGLCFKQGRKALMPTKRHGKARRLLKDGRAEAAKLEPSAIQLLYDSSEYTPADSIGRRCGEQNYRHFRDDGKRRAVRF